MSGANLLVTNNYNIFNNSDTFNAIAANPGTSDTLWANNAFTPPHLFFGAVDLENVMPGTSTNNQIFVPSSTGMFIDNIAANNWLTQKDTNGIVIQQLTSLGTAANIYLYPSVRSSTSGGSSGYELSSFSVVYQAINAITSGSVTLSTVAYNNGTAPVVTALATTGTFTLPASANLYVSTFTVTSPTFIGPLETMTLVLSLTSPLGNKVNIYGVFLNYTNST